MKTQHTKHIAYKLAYHFAWCPKYRKRTLVGKIAVPVEQQIRRLCEANRWELDGVLLVFSLNLFGTRASKCIDFGLFIIGPS